MTTLVIVVALALSWTSTVNAASASVPNVLLFQAALFDDGGTPRPDGPLSVVFRVTDAAGSVLYEERQEIEALRGQVSALVGNGLTADGAPTGGVPASALEPSAARYLTVEADGQPPSGPMEIASVPYALFANEALGAAQGAIDGRAIADGGIEFEDLSVDLLPRLAAALADGRGGQGEVLVRGDLTTMYRDPSAAAAIGVVPRFSYSAANDLQGVLQDLDRAITRREERVSAADAAIAQERTDRGTAVAAESQARSSADAAETSARASADTAEAINRDNAIAAAIGNEMANRDNAIAAAIGNEVTNRDNAIAAEAAVRQEAEAAIDQRLADIESPPVPQFPANAWCQIDSCATRNFACGNAAPTPEGPTRCRIAFSQSLAGDRYAVAANPDVTISERSSGGFLATCSGVADCRFDFIAIGP